MFVTNHVMVGALIGRRYADRPMSAFVVGLGSHLAVDALPHWGCDMSADDGPQRFLRFARRDGLVGLATAVGSVLVADRSCRAATVAAITGSVLLDLDKPFQHFVGRNPFPEVVQRVHGGIQRESEAGLPVEFVAGILLAVADLILAGRHRRGRRMSKIRHSLSTRCSCAGQSPATLPS